jgi:hypothetical protein
MLENYRNEGAAINVLSNQHGLDLTVIDAGVIPASARSGEPPSWIAPGTRNFRFEPAMSAEQCTRAIETAARSRPTRSLAAPTHCCSARWESATRLAQRCCCIVAPVGRSRLRRARHRTRRRGSGTQMPAARGIFGALPA